MPLLKPANAFTKILPRLVPVRVWICVMMFTACWTNYVFRLQMPILAVPMIKALPGEEIEGACGPSSRLRRAISWLDPGAYLEDYVLSEEIEAAQRAANLDEQNGTRVRRDTPTQPVRPSSGPIELFNGLPFDWSPEIRGQLIAAYSYGTVPGNFIGGLITIKWGPKRAVLWTTVLMTFMSLVSPILAQLHWVILMFSRIVVGVTCGVTFPACHALVAQWAPPSERARFIWSMLGGTFGTIVTYPMVAGVAHSINWECGWYIPALLTIAWILSWALLTYDTPAEHPGISEEEREYIMKSQEGRVRRERPSLKQMPIKEIFTSIPFLSLMACHFGNMFLLFFYQNGMMLYLTKALGFNLAKGGFAASLPWASRISFGFFFSWAGDTIQKKNVISLTVLRKCGTIFSHFIPGIFLILVGYVGCRFVLANVFLVLALGFNGAVSIANLANSQDLSPNFASFLFGTINMVGSASGMIISPLIEEIAGKYGNPIDKWQTLFWIGSVVCIVCMLIFVFGGSGNIQSWNEIRSEPDAEGERQ